jgi:hypothetical protein
VVHVRPQGSHGALSTWPRLRQSSVQPFRKVGTQSRVEPPTEHAGSWCEVDSLGLDTITLYRDDRGRRQERRQPRGDAVSARCG